VGAGSMVEDSGFARYFAEGIGTFVLTFTVGCNLVAMHHVWGGVSVACSFTVMIYALSKVSGGNFNPAVSLALGLIGHLGWQEVAFYIASQVVGGAAAGCAFAMVFARNLELAPTAGHLWWQACTVELLYTFMLCFVFLNVMASKAHAGKNQFYGIAIGFVLVAASYSGGGISMGCFNPAVAVGVDFWRAASVMGKPKKYSYSLAYCLFEFLGAWLAVQLYKVVRPGDAEGEAVTEVPLYSKLASEFIGSYMLVLTVGLCVMKNAPAGNFAIACALMCMIFALRSVSGGHFNPAVTAAVMVAGRERCSWKQGLQYMAAQVTAGICAALTYTVLMGGRTFALKPSQSQWHQALIGEFVFTFVLGFVVLSVATVREEKVLTEYFGFAIGMCVMAGGLAIGDLSGGALNPCVSIGLSLVHLTQAWACLPYALVELLAGLAAAGVFRLTQPSEFGPPKPSGVRLLDPEAQEGGASSASAPAATY